jgi:hypothetical protein
MKKIITAVLIAAFPLLNVVSIDSSHAAVSPTAQVTMRLVSPAFSSPDGVPANYVDFSSDPIQNNWAKYYGSGLKVYYRYFDVASTLTFKWRVTDTASGAGLPQQPVWMIVNKNYGGKQLATFTYKVNGELKTIAALTGDTGETQIPGTTDADGFVTFEIVNTNTSEQAEPTPPAPNREQPIGTPALLSQITLTTHQLGGATGGGDNGALDEELENKDLIWAHFVKSSGGAVVTPTPAAPEAKDVTMRLLEPAMTKDSNGDPVNYADFSFDAKANGWEKYYGSGIGVFYRYFEPGSTFTTKWKLTDTKTKAPLANQDIWLVINKNYGGSQLGSFIATYNGVDTVAKASKSDTGETQVQGKTDSNGEVTFTLKNTNLATEAEAAPPALNLAQPEGAKLLFSSITVTTHIPETKESKDFLWAHIAEAIKVSVPVNKVAPKISGTAKVGQTLKLDSGTWSDKSNLKIQWFACKAKAVAGNAVPAGCKAIAGATGATLKIAAANKSSFIVAQVKSSNAAGSAEKVTSSTVKVG